MDIKKIALTAGIAVASSTVVGTVAYQLGVNHGVQRTIEAVQTNLVKAMKDLVEDDETTSN